MWRHWLDTWQDRYVFLNLVTTQLALRYQRSALGFFWTLLNPLLMLTIQAFVFSAVLGANFKDYVVYLLAGLVPWQFFGGGMENGCRAMLFHEGLIRKVSVKKLILPLAEITVAGINMLFALTALFVICLLSGAPAHIQLVILPIGFLLMGVFLTGCALVGMTLVTRFRDVEHFLSIFLQALYFATPIVYKLENVKRLEPYVRFNPLTHFIAFFQHGIYYGTWPALSTWLWAIGMSVGMLFIGYVTYAWNEDDYVYRL